MIRICHLSSVHPPFDTRIYFKECKSLASAGFDVTFIARSSTSSGELSLIPPAENTPKGEVHIIPFYPYKNRFSRILLSPYRMLREALKQKASLYHFHDPELIPVGIMLRIAGKKVIYDVHEDFHKQIKDKPYLHNSFLKSFLSLSVLCLEKIGALFFNQIITATPSISLNFNPRKTNVVRNVPVLAMMGADVEAATDVVKEKPVVTYAGVLTRIRGIKEIIMAMDYVGPKAELWLLGKWESNAFYEECRSLEGWKYVHFLGQKPQEKVYAYMKLADIGLVNFYPLANHMEALPNKIYEYMALSLPMVLSHFPSWKDAFESCALFADPKNPMEIAQQIEALLDNPDLMQEKGRKGRELIETGFSWESEQERLIEIYKKILY